MFTFDNLLQYWHTGKVEESLTTEVVHQRQHAYRSTTAARAGHLMYRLGFYTQAAFLIVTAVVNAGTAHLKQCRLLSIHLVN